MKKAIFFGIFIVFWASGALCQSGAVNHIKIITILASNGETFTDPRLSGMIGELQSVFRYSSYRMLSQSAMNLTMGQTGSATLPGNRTLNIALMKIDGTRAQLKLNISKSGQSVFETVIQLLDRGTITVGGPQHEGGYLLFNISNSF